MNSSVTKSFRAQYARLPRGVRAVAYKNHRLWRAEPRHPSLHFKQIGDYWSVRVGLSYRALGREKDGRLYWFWIGHHAEYDRLIKGQ
jgi:hypothetical protein